MKFVLFVEGETEDLGVSAFINRWLADQFERGSGVGIQVKAFEGWSDLRDDAPKNAKRYLTDPAYFDVIAVISLLDLYGPSFYPADITSIRERYNWGKTYMEDRVRDYFAKQGLPDNLAAKYHHFFAVHETEAWLLTRPDLFDKDIRDALKKQKPPEQVNFNMPPGKLLEKLYIQNVKRAYKKTVMARNIFPKLDVQATADKCPYLKAMLSDLRTMALAAGAKPAGDWAED